MSRISPWLALLIPCGQEIVAQNSASDHSVNFVSAAAGISSRATVVPIDWSRLYQILCTVGMNDLDSSVSVAVVHEAAEYST